MLTMITEENMNTNNGNEEKKLSWTAQNRKNTKNLAFWTLGWVLSMALASLGSALLWPGDTLLSGLTIALNLFIGIGMIWSNKRHLLGLDEMEQRVQLESMGITLGVGLIFGLAYSNLDQTNLIPFNAEISHLVILMGLTYLVSVYSLLRRLK